MATLKRTSRSNPLSNFNQAGTHAGFGFDLIAEGLEALNERLEPAAIEEMKRQGYEAGAGGALAQMGGNRVSRTAVSSDNFAPQIQETAEAIGMDPVDLATIISYETGGTFDPTQPGPTTQWGQHRGLIQFGEPQAREYGVDWDDPVGSQFGANGAIANYFRRNGWKPGMDLMQAYSIVNAGAPNRFNASDANNGGAPGTVADKVNNQMSGHRERALAMFSQPSVTQTAEPEVMVRTSDGKLEPRLFSPMSGPILQAFNAAAGVAYQSEVMNRSAFDLLDMSHQFRGNPQGFADAAKGYLDKMVEDAPAMFRQGIRDGIRTEISRRTLGMMEEQQRETLKRANNSSAALVDRWKQTYVDALAAGNTEEAERARSELDSVLRAREGLPGVAWTPEQSANVFIDAQRSAERQMQRRDTEVAREVKDSLDLIIKSAKEGLYSDAEGILTDEVALAMHPELAREAQAFVNLRDNMPEFMNMTPQQMDEAIAAIREEPIQEEWQIDLLQAAESVAKEARKAWEDDPVTQAGNTLPVPPPAMPPLDTAQPDDFISFFAERARYMNDVFDAGYTDTRAFFTEDEAEDLKAIMGPETPAEVRAAIAGAVVTGFGDDAVAVMDEIGGDSTTVYAGKAMAVTGNTRLGAEILRGQQLLREGAVRVPHNSTFTQVFGSSFADAFAGIPDMGSTSVVTQVIEASRAIYAARIGTGDLEGADAEAAIEQAISVALGQATNKRGQVTGGVQQIFGTNTLLPADVNAEVAQSALVAATGTPQGNGFSRMIAGAFSDTPMNTQGFNANPEAWRAASRSGSLPMQYGQPLDPNLLMNGQIRLIAAGPNGYRMEIQGGTPVEDENGNVFFFDLNALIEAVR